MQTAAVEANLGQISADYKTALSSACIPPNQREELQVMYETRITDLEKQAKTLQAELDEMKKKERK